VALRAALEERKVLVRPVQRVLLRTGFVGRPQPASRSPARPDACAHSYRHTACAAVVPGRLRRLMTGSGRMGKGPPRTPPGMSHGAQPSRGGKTNAASRRSRQAGNDSEDLKIRAAIRLPDRCIADNVTGRPRWVVPPSELDERFRVSPLRPRAVAQRTPLSPCAHSSIWHCKGPSRRIGRRSPVPLILYPRLRSLIG
jgi:hypothetical protein